MKTQFVEVVENEAPFHRREIELRTCSTIVLWTSDGMQFWKTITQVERYSKREA
ncbi:MAG: hypothetical protein LC734_02730 [Acidobacteria bacterium]|nr:hypothetical protein [Acidobacteriota bacterium]